MRWVLSQENAADDPSRNRSRHLTDSDVAEAQITAWNRKGGERAPGPVAVRTQGAVRREGAHDDCGGKDFDVSTGMVRSLVETASTLTYLPYFHAHFPGPTNICGK